MDAFEAEIELRFFFSKGWWIFVLQLFLLNSFYSYIRPLKEKDSDEKNYGQLLEIYLQILWKQK